MRLFVAVNLPARERERILASTAALRSSGLPVRWVTAAAYHLTLKFLGEVPEAGLQAIGEALESAATGIRPFTLELGGAGVFPDRRRPAVWWLGIAPSAQLQLLHSRVEQELGPLGFPAETRPFSPHLTLGRTERKAHQGALRGAEARLQDVAYHSTISVETVDLMRSHLASSGARYECVFAILLRP